MPEIRTIYEIEEITTFILVCGNKDDEGEDCGHESRFSPSEITDAPGASCPKCGRSMAGLGRIAQDAEYVRATGLLMGLGELVQGDMPFRVRFEMGTAPEKPPKPQVQADGASRLC